MSVIIAQSKKGEYERNHCTEQEGRVSIKYYKLIVISDMSVIIAQSKKGGDRQSLAQHGTVFSGGFGVRRFI